MNYDVYLLRRAQRELASLPEESYQRVRDAIRGLAAEPRPRGCRKLRGREGWRVRVGVVRVIYEIDDGRQTVMVLNVSHRKDAYRSE